MTGIRRLDEVSIFNGKLSFLIPHEWIEAESGDSEAYLYQAPDGHSGWLRVSLITTKGVPDPGERIMKLFSDFENVTRDEITGNLTHRSEKDTVEDGDRLHIYYWFVGGVVLPDIAYEAVFSYTVLADNATETTTKSEIQVLDQLVSKARFHAVDGNRPS
ncbi:MAG TPA: hypothetical protein VKW06_09235 [Candidatus Angelobacter sp.]|nr:hypothetical protein [Candidatus Angelobacter sp.]